MRAMLVLKMGCQHWLEDHGGDTSGFVFKSVKEGSQSPAGAAQEFCVRSKLCGKGKKKQAEQEKERLKERALTWCVSLLDRLFRGRKMLSEAEKKEEEQKKEDLMSSLPEDSKFGLQRMLELARDDPLHYMEDDAKERVRQGVVDLRCAVCNVVLQEAFQSLRERPKSLQSEHEMLNSMEKSCEGGPDLSIPSYFGIEPPRLPPTWTDRYRPSKKEGRYVLRPYKSSKRQKWRRLALNGKQKPLEMEENEQVRS